MLEIKDITKTYKTGELTQQALDHVSINLRDNEFVSVLGPSGSGKTTFLNIIGGLDRYDTGDLIIDGISTKKYNDRDWDTYRNHTIGFVFQSYNLIQHLTILANVELALTISGISGDERKRRSMEALDEVGLKGQYHKKPNQLSGGQMQRVAIARALVNNPKILLADEPTGALDSETSIQVMELLKKVAEKRLVVMVTHNPELAYKYSTRIVKLKDGKIIDDSNPFQIENTELKEKKRIKRAGMSFFTSLSLSFSNLRTKKGRTILTAFAGSIGIIGIALILSISSGVNKYIDDIQTETMSSYPITITSQTIDMTALMGSAGMSGGGSRTLGKNSDENNSDKIIADTESLKNKVDTSSSVAENNLTKFKEYLDNPDSEIHNYVGENGILYSYDLNFTVYSKDADGNIVANNSDTDAAAGLTESMVSTMQKEREQNMSMMANGGQTSQGTTNFSQLMEGNDSVVSCIITDSYDVLTGAWPENYDEVVLVLDEENKLDAGVLYQLGLISADDYKKLATDLKDEKEIDEITFNYDDILNHEFTLVPACDNYKKDGDIFKYYGSTSEEIEKLMKKGLKLKVTGIVRPKKDAENAVISTAIGYTSKLTDYVIDYTNDSKVVKAQGKDKDTDILTGISFEDEKNYDTNMALFGKCDYDSPSSVSIYADHFEDKDKITECIENYNKTVDKDDRITYTDYVALITSSITEIVNVISYVLIAFVAVSLLVSGIMIGIITNISVLERTKEIGILRALGASKRNVSEVFNAETFIIGLISGALGIIIATLLNFPINNILADQIGTDAIKATLTPEYALVLIVISVIITMIGGFIPSKNAAKKDPVIALRTE